MKSQALLAATLAAFPAVALGNAPDGRPVLNSFVNRRVTDVRSLVAHVAADPVVADRYERHFAMDRAGLLRYLGGLHRGALAQDGTYTVYSVPKGGRLKMHVGRLRRGEPMFLDRQGRPTLVVKCGNPVVLGPVRAAHGNPVALAPQTPRGSRVLDFAAQDAAPSDVLALDPAVPVALASTTTTTTLIETAPTVPAEGVGGGSLNLGALLMPLAGSLSMTIPTGHSNPVPEPASLLAVAAGLAALARRRK